MNKHNFKIGDKVKLCNRPYQGWDVDEHVYRENIIGEVISIGRSIQVQWDTPKCVVCGASDCGCIVTFYYHKPDEIEHVLIKGDQLLFDFMY